MKNFAVLGFGTVGSGVVELFFKNKENLEKKTGSSLNLKYILDVRDFPDSEYAALFTKDFETILNDPEVSVVAEVIGGIEPAYSFTKRCLQSGKSVVTSNKELVAQKGAELLAIARENNVNYLFEASVGGGIPVIHPIHTCLAANEIQAVIGILNGTTNFILTKMFQENMAFDVALKLAQELGYAERNPSADVDGHDACRKICILSSLAFGEHVYPEDVFTQGIAAITPEDVAYASGIGYSIKLIGQTRRGSGGKICAMVSPALVPHGSQLASTSDVFNAVLVRGDATGDVVFYGKGAGKLPTASAVLSDVVDCVCSSGTIPSVQWAPSEGGNVYPREEQTSAMYIRCRGAGAENAAIDAFGRITVIHRQNQPEDEFAFLIQPTLEREIDTAVEKLKADNIEILGQIRLVDC